MAPTDGAGGAVARAAAFAVGLWGVTHVVTHALFAQAGPLSDEPAYRSTAGPLAIAALALILASAFALSVSARVRSANRRPDRSRSGGAYFALTPAVAPLAFVATEVVTHLGSHHATPPIDLLIVGSLLHVVIVTVARQLWIACFDRTVRLLSCLALRPAPPAHGGAFFDMAAPCLSWTPIDYRPSRAPPA